MVDYLKNHKDVNIEDKNVEDKNVLYGVFDRDDELVSFYYTKNTANNAAEKMNKETPSLEFSVKKIKNTDIYNAE